MRIEIGPLVIATRQKSAGNFVTPWSLGNGAGWWPMIREGFAGAWQRSITMPVVDALTHPTFWACVTLIAGDIAKMRPMLVSEDADGIESEVSGASGAAFLPVIRKPNHYQDRIQFFTYWMMSKLTRGNTYALKERDARGVVTALYLLDPTRVQPMVAPGGYVYYAVQQDLLSGVDEARVVVPASEIIHDRCFAPYHPLVGLSPVSACGQAATLALKIARNTTRFAENGSMLGGLLVAPGQISADTASRLERYWNENYSGAENAGKIAAIGDGLKFEKPNVMSSVDAQIIDQLKWSDEKVCSTLHVPPYMVGVGPLPSYNNVEALAQQYYSQCLQIHAESIELCLTEGLEVEDAGYEVELDTDCLLRMDSAAQMDAATKGVIGGIYKPNEARARFNLKPVPGGDEVYLQKQNWPLEKLGSDNPPPVPVQAPAPTPTPPIPQADAAKGLGLDGAELLACVMRGLEAAA